VSEIVELLSSPVSRFSGRPADGPAPAPDGELVDAVHVRAGLGIVGDRYFNKRAHRSASVTLMAAEALPAGASLAQTRRNVLLRGVDIDALVGRDVELDSGDGPVRLRLNRPANRCAWMDVMVGPGTVARLKGRSGVRAEPLTDGVLRVGPVEVRVVSDD